MIDFPLHHRPAHPDQWNIHSGSATDTLIAGTTQTGALGRLSNTTASRSGTSVPILARSASPSPPQMWHRRSNLWGQDALTFHKIDKNTRIRLDVAQNACSGAIPSGTEALTDPSSRTDSGADGQEIDSQK